MDKNQLTLDSFFQQKRLEPIEPAFIEKKIEIEVEPEVFTVSDLNKQIRSTLETGFSLIWLKGEISNFKPHSSGHFYFSLKDERAQISAVMFRGFNQSLKFAPKDGMEVIVRGKVTVYEPRGNYQIFCETMEVVGQGGLQVEFEKLKTKLQLEGLFDQKKKRQLPKWPKKIAMVTSPTGAAVRDMLHILSRRSKSVEILICPSVVQGAQAPEEIVAAIAKVNLCLDVDLLIVGRGGGSIEDLWAFNDERVARAIAASRIPTISAVGHEIDFTIADFVADVRAPTPSAAAELAVTNSSEISQLIDMRARQLRISLGKKMAFEKERVAKLTKSLIDPKIKLRNLIQRCDELVLRLEAEIFKKIDQERARVLLYIEKIGNPLDYIESKRADLGFLSEKLQVFVKYDFEARKNKILSLNSMLDSLSPLRVVDRGYAIVKMGDTYVRSVNKIKKDDEMNLVLSDGQAKVRVLSVEK